MPSPEATILIEGELILDTGTVERIAGLRGSVGRRHLLFRAGQLYLDLQLQRPRGAGETVMAGQILGAGSAGNDLIDLPLELEYEDGTLLRARSDGLGEFLLTCPAKAISGLAVEMTEELRLNVPLPADLLTDGEELR